MLRSLIRKPDMSAKRHELLTSRATNGWTKAQHMLEASRNIGQKIIGWSQPSTTFIMQQGKVLQMIVSIADSRIENGLTKEGDEVLLRPTAVAAQRPRKVSIAKIVPPIDIQEALKAQHMVAPTNRTEVEPFD